MNWLNFTDPFGKTLVIDRSHLVHQDIGSLSKPRLPFWDMNAKHGRFVDNVCGERADECTGVMRV